METMQNTNLGMTQETAQETVQHVEVQQETTPEVVKKNELVEAEEGVYVFEFGKPFSWCGEEYKEIVFNFNDMTGADMIDIEQEMNDQSEFALQPELSPAYCARLAAKAAHVDVELIKKLPLRDFNKIKNCARNFLTGLA